MLSFLREIALIALLAAVTCVVVGCVLPLVLQRLLRGLCSGLAEGALRIPLPLVAIAVVALRVYVLLVAA